MHSVRAVVAPAVLPLVVAVYPVLHLYAANPGQSHFPWAMIAALAAGAVTLAIALGWALGDRDKAALLVALTLALALSYGHVFDGIRGHVHRTGLSVASS
jgi:cytochrome bd-type quinol oxidase subunit 2